jgi:hypothetical protein
MRDPDWRRVEKKSALAVRTFEVSLAADSNRLTPIYMIFDGYVGQTSSKRGSREKYTKTAELKILRVPT